MARYDFRSLSPFDFETITRDLLQDEFKVRLESFAQGRDGGIDLRYTRDLKNSLIVQCKHFVNSGWSALRRHLQKEVKKVRVLEPKRYVLSTSVPLTPANKDDILSLFSPYIARSDDIFGQDDLNNLLAQNERVERNHFKLWLTSTAIFQKLLHSHVYTQTDSHLVDLEKRIRLYVTNPSFERASEILQTRRFCLVAGIPGIGKSILAEMLLVSHAEQDFEPIVVSADISEADAVFDPSKKQFFYYDDFLGQTGHGDKLGKNEDARLLAFIRRVASSANKRLVLTTREYILADAQLRYERLSSLGSTIDTCIVNLADYGNLTRAKILYNHIYFSDLSASTRESLLNDKGYNRIIKHPNYNPRLIDKIIELGRSSGVEGVAFREFMLGNLDNPASLWSHAYDYQLSEVERTVLVCLASLPDEVELGDLEEATNRLSGRRIGRDLRAAEFKRALKVLDGTFITLLRDSGETFVRYNNASIRDFVHGLLDLSPREVTQIVDGAVAFEQCVRLWAHRVDLPGMGKALVGYRENLEEALIRTFDARGYTFEVVHSFGPKRRRCIASSVGRLTEFLRIVGAERRATSESWLVSQLDAVVALWAAGSGDSMECANLLATERVPARVVSAGKTFLLMEAQTTDDIDALNVLAKTIPLSSEDVEQIHNMFAEVADAQVEALMGDSNLAQAEWRLSWIQTTSKALDVGYVADLDAIYQRIGELERGEPGDDYHYDLRREEASLERAEEREIESMFGSLFDTDVDGRK